MLSSEGTRLQSGSTVGAMVSIDGTTFVAVKPSAVAAKCNQVPNWRSAILEIEEIPLHQELNPARYRLRFCTGALPHGRANAPAFANLTSHAYFRGIDRVVTPIMDVIF